jgi:predicted alpha/beta-hydrolase family hydrolase
MKGWLLFLIWAAGSLAAAAQEFVQVDIGRNEARLPVFVMRSPQATATLILLPGADAGPGKIVNGQPMSRNFLSRSRGLFHAEDFNVLVAYRPSDLDRLDYSYRVSKAHLLELEKVIAFAKREFGKPVWLVGTSRGTVSAVSAALALGDGAVQGLVLTSSVTSGRAGALAGQNLAGIKVPTLVVHHKNDACWTCVPAEAARIPGRLVSAPVRKFLLVEGGSDPAGDPCEAMHWHGFVNYEKETVKAIAEWIRNPRE